MVLRYDTRCYFNVRSKADISQLNLPHGATGSLVEILSRFETVFSTISMAFSQSWYIDLENYCQVLPS